MNKHYLLLGFVLFCGTLCAQDSLTVTDHAKSTAVVSRLTRELNLSTTQQEQVYLVMQNRWRVIKESETKNEAIDWQSINEGTLADLKNILRPEQYTLFKTLKEETDKQKNVFKRQSPNYKFSEVDSDLDF